MRMRITMKKTGSQADDLLATDVRRTIWEHAPVEVDPDNPLRGTHRDEQGQVYFEFSTALPEEVHRVLREHHPEARLVLTESREPVGEACQKCGNIAGPVLPAVCPNCGFRDVSPCPVCKEEIPREQYVVRGKTLVRCPKCRSRLRMRFNEPLCLPDGEYNQPLVVVEEAESRHEVR